MMKSHFHIVLFEPEIPPNTGNIIRLCSNTNSTLHLIEPMGFSFDDKKLKRAGLDYQEWSETKIYPNFEKFIESNPKKRLFTLSSKSKKTYSQTTFETEDYFIFGPETRGLPQSIMQQIPEEQQLTIPMAPLNRSLNLSNAVAVVIYEACRQHDFNMCQ